MLFLVVVVVVVVEGESRSTLALNCEIVVAVVVVGLVVVSITTPGSIGSMRRCQIVMKQSEGETGQQSIHYGRVFISG